MKEPTLEELRAWYDELEQHDWFYVLTEDPRVWLAGEQSRRNIMVKVGQYKAAGGKWQAFVDLHEQYSAFIKAKLHQGTAEKPERP